MAAALFTGAGVALVTLFHDDGRLLFGAAADAGAAAVLALSPAHTDDVRPHCDALAGHAAGLALLAYHFPAVSPPGIPVEVLNELPIAGVKDSSGDAGRLVAELGAYDDPLANTDPEGCIAALAGDMEAQRALLPGHRESRGDFPAGLERRL
jgi:4-hydroxy-tetrahydrodipicolinate synthase